MRKTDKKAIFLAFEGMNRKEIEENMKNYWEKSVWGLAGQRS
jgi:hypothetical protein